MIEEICTVHSATPHFDATVMARKQAAAEAGALPAVLAAMQAHESDECVQCAGCQVIVEICTDAEADAYVRSVGQRLQARRKLAKQ